MYCFDTDVVSAALRPRPPLHLLRRLARTPAAEQCTTAITVGEIVYGGARIGRPGHADRMHELLSSLHTVLSFDEEAAIVYGSLRAELERGGTRLDDPDLRIASIALSRELTLVTGNVRHFERVPGLRIENWLEPD
jgi:tRNA(fMet)-specific endonuclease VapC